MSFSHSSSTTVTAALFTIIGMGLGVMASSYLYTHQGKGKQKDESNTTSILSCIQKRRSIFPKQYTGRQVSRDVIQEMLEAARWAPNHNITEPWNFIVFESLSSRKDLGTFLAETYKTRAAASKFSQAKYEKKMKNCQQASHVIAICCSIMKQKNPMWEEISTMAMAVQNMHLIATYHDIGAYWSSPPSSPENKSNDQLISSSPQVLEFLNLDPEKYVCLGWFFVGEYYNEEDTLNNKKKKWPAGRRSAIEVGRNVTWK